MGSRVTSTPAKIMAVSEIPGKRVRSVSAGKCESWRYTWSFSGPTPLKTNKQTNKQNKNKNNLKGQTIWPKCNQLSARQAKIHFCQLIDHDIMLLWWQLSCFNRRFLVSMVTGFLLQCYGLSQSVDMVSSLHLKNYENKLMTTALFAWAKLSQTCHSVVFFWKTFRATACDEEYSWKVIW